MSDDASTLVLRGVHKSIAGRAVLDDVTVECAPGSITVLLGPNGAGKTTTVALAAGLRRPDSGMVRILGVDPRSASGRRLFAIVPQEMTFPQTVPVATLLDFVEGQRTTSRRVPARGQVCESLGLAPLLRRTAGGLSGGQRRRLAIALALLRTPDLLLLDEASANLDEESRRTVWRLVREYTDLGGTVLTTTHLLAEAEVHADHVIGLVDGRVTVRGTVTEIRQQLGGSVVSVRVPAATATAVASRVAEAQPDIYGHPEAGDVTLQWRTRRPLELCAELAAGPTDDVDVMVRPASLHEVLTRLPDRAASSEAHR